MDARKQADELGRIGRVEVRVSRALPRGDPGIAYGMYRSTLHSVRRCDNHYCNLQETVQAVQAVVVAVVNATRVVGKSLIYHTAAASRKLSSCQFHKGTPTITAVPFPTNDKRIRLMHELHE